MEQTQAISKTKRKQQMLELQSLGERLVALRESQLLGLDLPDALLRAVLETKRTKGFEAIRRQMQFVGRVMREVDAEPIRDKLAALQAPGRKEVANMHLVERWRDQLLRDGLEPTALLEAFPGVDLVRLQEALTGAQRDTAPQLKIKHFREIFRLLNQGLPAASRDNTANLPRP